jgi:hypothetical protein
MSFNLFDGCYDDCYWDYNQETNSLEMWRKGDTKCSMVIDARDLVHPEKINVYDIRIDGWLVADDNYDIWFFPGKDNKPVKENGEWVGACPFHIQDHGGVKDELKETPEFTTLRS